MSESKIPAHAPQPQDHKPPKKTAAQIEAEGIETVSVQYAGETYHFPADLDDAPGEVLEFLEVNQVTRGLGVLMSKGDLAKFKATKPKVRDYRGLFEAYQSVIGLSGN